MSLSRRITSEIGDLAFDQNGTLYACLRRGDVVVSQPGKDLSKIEWQVFATGLHNGMGMEVIAPGKIVVSQMAELTLIEDPDGDGVADRYRNLCSDFGLSGNYHETNAICPDGDGGFYIALGTASHNGPTFTPPAESINMTEEEAVTSLPLSKKAMWSTTKRMAPSPPLPMDSVCTTALPVIKMVTFGAGTTRGIGGAAHPIYRVKKDGFLWASLQPRLG